MERQIEPAQWNANSSLSVTEYRSAVGADGINIDGYTFAAPQPDNQNTYLFKLDYNITQNGNYRLFLRGNLQNDRELVAPEFPGEPPSHIVRDNNKGFTAGYTAVLSGTVINNFRYAFIREGTSDAGECLLECRLLESGGSGFVLSYHQRKCSAASIRR